MNAARAARKEDQLRNMVDAVRILLHKMHPHMMTEAPSCTRNAAPHSAVASAPPPSPRPVLVDFCCGSGHLGFPLAYFFPWCDIILLEHNASAIATAHRRLAQLQIETSPPMRNVRIVHAGLQEFDEHFDLAVGLHACGWLSDCIQIKCMQRGASFLLAPCCVGKCKVSRVEREDPQR